MADPSRCKTIGLRPDVSKEQLYRALVKARRERDDLAMDVEEAYKERALVSRPRKKQRDDAGVDPNEAAERKRVTEEVTRDVYRWYKFSRKEDLYGWTNEDDGRMCSRAREGFRQAGLRFNRHIWVDVCTIEREWVVRRRSYIVTLVRGGCIGKN